jgi:hypothetical protein
LDSAHWDQGKEHGMLEAFFSDACVPSTFTFGGLASILYDKEEGAEFLRI